MPGYIYILASQKNGTLYIGSTTDIARRLEEHRSKAIGSFTRKHGVIRLVHAEEFASIMEARERETQLKNWHWPWKINLIEENNPSWEDLAKFL